MYGQPIREFTTEQLPVSIYPSNAALGVAAALEARDIINAAIAARGESNIIIATGNSQLTFLHALRDLDGIDWGRVEVFHMDEYLGLAPDHPASFPYFLHQHIIDAVKPRAFHPVPNSPKDIETACRGYEALLRSHPADLCALGIGENGHLAFNDPPYADFDDPVWVKVIELAPASRRQQVGEGHFTGLDEVPTHAITLTIPALLSAKRVLAMVPEARKADAVYHSLHDPISESCPATLLRRTPHAHLYLDPDSSARLG